MPPLAIGAAISGASSLVGGILGHNAASDAAAAQKAAATQAAGQQAAAGQMAQGYQTTQLAGEKAAAAPYTALGSQTSQQLLNALAPGGSLSQGWNQTFTAPTAAQAAATPGYQFQQQQMLNALQNSAAARGGLLSTGTAKNLLGYTQGLASSDYQNTFNNALQAYNTNFNVFNTNQNRMYNQLYGATGLGLNASNALNAATAGTTNALTGQMLGNQQVVGSDLMGAANAQAAGIVGGTNALTAGLAGGANALGQGLTLQGILGAQNASNNQAPQPAPFDPNWLPSRSGWNASTYAPYSSALTAPNSTLGPIPPLMYAGGV